MLTSMSDIDAGRVVDRVGVDAPALYAVGDAAALGDAEIGALADHLARRIASPSMRSASLARSPTWAWVSPSAFTKVPMPPKNSRSTCAFRRRWISSAGVAVVLGNGEGALQPRRVKVIDFGAAPKMPPPAEISRLS